MSTSKGDFLKNRALAAAGARFFRFGGSKLGAKIDQKSMPVAKRDFLKNRALPAAGARFFKIRGAKLGAKIDQQSIKI